MRSGFTHTIIGAAVAAFAVGAMPTGPASAQSFSCSTARLIVPWGAGGGTDVIYRIVKYVYSDKNDKYMKTVYKSWNPQPGIAAFKNAGVKMHPGALKAYKELGLK